MQSSSSKFQDKKKFEDKSISEIVKIPLEIKLLLNYSFFIKKFRKSPYFLFIPNLIKISFNEKRKNTPKLRGKIKSELGFFKKLNLDLKKSEIQIDIFCFKDFLLQPIRKNIDKK